MDGCEQVIAGWSTLRDVGIRRCLSAFHLRPVSPILLSIPWLRWNRFSSDWSTGWRWRPWLQRQPQTIPPPSNFRVGRWVNTRQHLNHQVNGNLELMGWFFLDLIWAADRSGRWIRSAQWARPQLDRNGPNIFVKFHRGTVVWHHPRCFSPGRFHRLDLDDHLLWAAQNFMFKLNELIRRFRDFSWNSRRSRSRHSCGTIDPRDGPRSTAVRLSAHPAGSEPGLQFGHGRHRQIQQPAATLNYFQHFYRGWVVPGGLFAGQKKSDVFMMMSTNTTSYLFINKCIEGAWKKINSCRPRRLYLDLNSIRLNSEI